MALPRPVPVPAPLALGVDVERPVSELPVLGVVVERPVPAPPALGVDVERPVPALPVLGVDVERPVPVPVLEALCTIKRSRGTAILLAPLFTITYSTLALLRSKTRSLTLPILFPV